MLTTRKRKFVFRETPHREMKKNKAGPKKGQLYTPNINREINKTTDFRLGGPDIG